MRDGYRAFVPTRLNHAPAPSLNLMEQLLPDADRALGRLDGAFRALHDADSVASLLRRKEAVASGQLEGVQASLLNLLDAEAGVAPAGSARDTSEAVALTSLLGTFWVPSVETMISAHDQLMRGMGRRAIGVRSSQNWLGTAGASLAEASFVPPAPAEISALLEDWQQYLDAGDALHPVVKLALTYAQLESIHPFMEANGRMTRAFLQMQLRVTGLLGHPALLWSQQLQRDRQSAQRALHALRRQGDVDTWVQFFLRAIARAAQDSCDVLQRVIALREQHRHEVCAQFGRVVPQALGVVDALIARPMLSIKDIIELTGTSFPAANELAQRLVRAGILAEITGQARNRRFRYAPYVRIFIDDAT
jgi:Fic family protein